MLSFKYRRRGDEETRTPVQKVLEYMPNLKHICPDSGSHLNTCSSPFLSQGPLPCWFHSVLPLIPFSLCPFTFCFSLLHFPLHLSHPPLPALYSSLLYFLADPSLSMSLIHSSLKAKEKSPLTWVGFGLTPRYAPQMPSPTPAMKAASISASAPIATPSYVSLKMQILKQKSLWNCCIKRNSVIGVIWIEIPNHTQVRVTSWLRWLPLLL